MMRYRRRLITASIIVATATLTTGVSMARQPDDRPTFGRIPEAFMRKPHGRPGPLGGRPAHSFKEDQETYGIPDYIGVIDETGTVVGYVSAEAMLTDNPPANPAEARSRQRARERAEREGKPIGEEVVDQDLNVVGHLEPTGFVPLGD